MDMFWLHKVLKSIGEVSGNCQNFISYGKLTPVQKEQITKAYLEMRLKLDQLEKIIKENETMMEKFNELSEDTKYLILRRYMPDLPLGSCGFGALDFVEGNFDLLTRIEKAECENPDASYFVANKYTYEVFVYSNLTKCVEDFVQDKEAFVKYLEEHPEMFK